jgi:hypothetical protein
MTASYNLSQLGSNYLQGGTGSVARTTASKLQESVSVKDFGAVGDGTTDDTAAIQAAVTACSIGGTVLFPAGQYKLTAAVTINKPITIQGVGTGSFVNDLGSYVIQTNASANAFTLVATTANYAFSQYGIINVCFKDIALRGASSGSRSLAGVSVDTTVNSGVFHIRECTFWNVNMRYFQTGVNFTGIAYLNRWYGGDYSYCNTGVKIAQGSSGTAGGQTRFFGTTFDLNATVGLSWMEDTFGGDLACFGCTFADVPMGLKTNDEAQITIEGCHFEACANSGAGAGIYVLTPASKSNPNNAGARTILGNYFVSNDASIWFDMQATTNGAGTAFYPAYINTNVFGDATALKLSVGSGPGFGSPGLVIGESNTGTNNSQLAASQIGALFFGTDLRKKRFTKRYTFAAGYVSGTTLDILPNGLNVLTVRMYLTANASVFTQLQVGDGNSGTRYITGINGQTQALNTWINYTTPTPLYVIGTNSLDNLFRIVGTTGMNGATGVIEVDGYVN